MNSFAGIFILVLTQLQNRFFVEHLPVAAYVRCVKEKECKKWNSVFLLYSVWHSSLWQWRFSRGNKNKLRTFQPQIWKKIKNSQPLTKFTGSYKKKCIMTRKMFYSTWFLKELFRKRWFKLTSELLPFQQISVLSQ